MRLNEREEKQMLPTNQTHIENTLLNRDTRSTGCGAKEKYIKIKETETDDEKTKNKKITHIFNKYMRLI